MAHPLFGGLFINFLWYAITFLIYSDISFDFEIKKKKTIGTLLLQEEKKGKKEKKKFDMRPPRIEPGSTDSESDVLTTPPSMHLDIHNQAQTHAHEET